MSNEQEIIQALEKTIVNTENVNQDYKKVLTTTGEVDVTLADGSTTPNLNKRVRTVIGNASLEDGGNQREFNTFVKTNGAALPWMSNVEYALHAPVTKSDGTLVQSTVVGNKTNPNVNMTGWKVPSLKTADNLSDVPNKAAARSNLSVYSQTEVDTAISNATPTIPNATTTDKGIVRLNNTLTSILSTQALTAAQGKVLQDNKLEANKVGAANGVASLDANTKVPVAQLPNASTTAIGAVQLNNTLTSTSTTEALSANMGRELRISLENAVIGGGGGVSKEYVDTELDKKLGKMETVQAATYLQNPMMLLGERVDVSGSIGEFNGSNSGFVPKPTASDTNKVLSSSGAWVAQSGGGTFPNATETVAGKAKIATTAMAQAGVNDTDFLTPKNLRDALNASGEAPIYACRAWASFDASTGVIANLVGGNIVSVVRSQEGMYIIMFKSGMLNNNYAILCSTGGAASGFVRATHRDTKSCIINTLNTSNILKDANFISIGVFC